MFTALCVVVVVLVVVAVHDRLQRKHAIISNYPIIGRIRYWTEALGAPLRQYIISPSDAERPFSRDQRAWVYASSKQQNNYFGYGTDNDLEQSTSHVIVRHSAFPLEPPHPGDAGYDPKHACACMKVLGGFRKRAKAFRKRSPLELVLAISGERI